MKTWRLYRNGGMKLHERIEAALSHFTTHEGALPRAVVVHPTNVEAATEALKDFFNLPVVACGGTLANEVWLEVAEQQGGNDVQKVFDASTDGTLPITL